MDVGDTDIGTMEICASDRPPKKGNGQYQAHCKGFVFDKKDIAKIKRLAEKAGIVQDPKSTFVNYISSKPSTEKQE